MVPAFFLYHTKGLPEHNPADLLSFGMTLFVDRFQLVIDQVRIHLGRRNIAVTHQLLDRSQISTIFQQMHCKAVAQRVGRDLLINVGGSLIVLQNLPEALAAHTGTVDIDKQCRFGRIGQHGLTNPDAPKAIARHEVLCTLEDVVSRAAVLLKPGGHFYMVHRPFRLAEIIVTMTQYKLEPKRMQLVYPFVDKEPNMVLIEGVRGGKSRMTVEKPLIVYKEPGVYMPEIYDIYGY